MMKRSIFLMAALGLLGSFASVTPAEAAPVYLTQAVFLNTSGLAATDFEATFAGTGGSISDVAVFNPAAGATVVSPPPGNMVAIDFTPALSGTFGLLDFSFKTTFGPVTLVSSYWTFADHAPIATGAPIAFNSAAVVIPEPTSLALLGIGMTSFVAFRRIFKRASV